jgi:hypothetical protein
MLKHPKSATGEQNGKIRPATDQVGYDKIHADRIPSEDCGKIQQIANKKLVTNI